jgi:hypothetical protein
MSICQVSGCRFNTYHTTKEHKCGKCHKNGHGKIECDSLVKKLQLLKIIEEENKNNFIPIRPLNTNSNINGSILKPDILYEHAHTIRRSILQNKNSCIFINVGMGNSIYVRMNNDKSLIEYIYLENLFSKFNKFDESKIINFINGKPCIKL